MKKRYAFLTKLGVTSLLAVTVFFTLLGGGLLILAIGYDVYEHSYAEVLMAFGVVENSAPGQWVRDFLAWRWAYLPWTGLGLALSLGLTIFLCCGAGRRPDRDEIVLNRFDRLPLDAVAVGLMTVAGTCLTFALGAWDNLDYRLAHLAGAARSHMLFLTLILFLLLTLVAMSTFCGLYTLAARVKAGAWWKNTLLWRLGDLLCRGVVQVGRALPLVWRTALGAGLVEFIFFVAAQYWYYEVHFLVFIGEIGLWVLIVLAAVQLQRLREAGSRLAAGELDYKVDTRGMVLAFKAHAEDLNAIGLGITRAVEERTRADHLRTELITNVSHDLRTPLTSIVNYIDLLSRATDEEERSRCLEVLTRQAARLRKLTDDLVEASKAASGSLAVELRPTDAGELIDQALGEYGERLAAAGLTTVWQRPAEPVMLRADGRHLWRALDNLLSNAVKYALPGTRLYVDLSPAGVIAVKNISRESLNIPVEELTERFVRGDAARSTPGSGLGLHIAQSLVATMGGTLRLTVDGDLFKAEISLPLA